MIVLENERELRSNYESILKLYDLCDRIAATRTGHPEVRADEIEGVRAMIRKMERQVEVFYHSEHYGKEYVPDIAPEINIETPPVKVAG